MTLIRETKARLAVAALCPLAAVVLCLLAAAGTTAPAFARALAGVDLPDRITVDSKSLVLNGIGLREATWLRVDVYVAGLYLETRSSDPQAILGSEETKRLMMKFVRAVDRDALLKGWREGFDRSSGPSAAALGERIATFESWVADMPKGGTMSLTYRPGAGVQVEIQGETKGTVPGADFARALFGIWLGAHPPNPGLKEGLLGKD